MDWTEVRIQTRLVAAGDIEVWHRAREAMTHRPAPGVTLAPTDAELARALIRIGAEAVARQESGRVDS
jgi:hypothetical protein